MSRDLNLLSANFKPKVELFLKEAKKKGLDIFITETGRTKERQQELYNQGRTTPGNIVTWTLNSEHLIPSNAIDIAFNKPSLYPSDMNLWNVVFDLAERCGLVAGYRLWGRDKPHLQNTDKIPDKELLKDYIMTPEQEQLVDSSMASNSCTHNGGTTEMKEIAARHNKEWRELKSK